MQDQRKKRAHAKRCHEATREAEAEAKVANDGGVGVESCLNTKIFLEKEIGNKRAKWKGQRRDTMQAN